MWIGRPRVGENSDAGSLAILVAAPVQRRHNQIKLPGAIRNPPHPVHRRFVRQLDSFPFLRAVFWRDEVKNGAAADRVTRVPPGADRNFRFAIAINVGGRNADVIEFRQVFGQDKLFPGWIPVPDELFFVCEDNIRLLVTIHVCNRDAVTDFDFRIDLDGAKLWNWDISRLGHAAAAK